MFWRSGPWQNSPESDLEDAEYNAEMQRDFPVGVEVRYSDRRVAQYARHGRAWGNAVARDRGRVVGYESQRVVVAWKPSYYSPGGHTAAMMPDDIAVVGGAGSLQGAFHGVARGLGVTAPGGAVTVAVFQAVLVSKLTQYDAKLQVRQPNIYRLGHFLEAAQRVEKATKKYANRGDPEALQAFLAALRGAFSLRGRWGADPATLPFDIPAVEATAKQVREYMATGKVPSLVRR